MIVISQYIRSILTETFITVLLLCASVSAQDYISSPLSGDNVCTAVISFTKVQKVPITGIQTKTVRYVTRCGMGLMQCSRYRVIYVPAYRELTSTMYRTDRVCCNGYDLVNTQCISSASSGNRPGTLTTTKTPRETLWPDQAHPTLAKSNTTQMVQKGTGRQDERDRRPSMKNVPHLPTLVDNSNLPQSTAEGKGYLDGKGNVFTIDERNYDVSPDVHKNPHGPSIISVAIGVGVVMSLTGVLIGMAIMKIRFRKIPALDAIPLTRNKKSRKATRSKTRPLPATDKQHQTQHERIVSYVSVQDIRENLMSPIRQSPITKNIPQCSLPRIPESSKELLDISLQDKTEYLSAETASPSYAVVNKTKASTEKPCCCNMVAVDNNSTGNTLGSTCISCSSSVYAKINIVCDKEDPVEVSNMDDVKQQKETLFNSLYAEVNKNKNSNNEDRHRFSLAIVKTDVDDSVYGKLDRSSSFYSSMESKDSSIKYDHLKRSPRPPGSSRKINGTSQLYEAV